MRGPGPGESHPGARVWRAAFMHFRARSPIHVVQARSHGRGVQNGRELRRTIVPRLTAVCDTSTMPELTEVQTTRRGLAPHLAGRRVAAVTLRRPDLRWRTEANTSDPQSLMRIQYAR